MNQTSEIAGNYEFLGIVDKPKAGVTYKVRNLVSGKFEQLRALPGASYGDPESRERFLREIRIHTRLSHPNIVAFHDALELDGQLVMTSEFVDGTTVAELCREGRLSSTEAVRAVCDVLSGLAEAHALGIVHRGITAEHVTITRDGEVKLGGFGLAKPASDVNLTRAGAVLGDPRYISPEQVLGVRALDHRSDLYSVGILLFQALTGRVPFDSANEFDIMVAQVGTEPPRPSSINPAIAPQLERIVLTALAKTPEQRFANATEFRLALEALSPAKKALPEPKPAVEAVSATTEPLFPAMAEAAGMPRTVLVLGIIGVAIVVIVLVFWGGTCSMKPVDIGDVIGDYKVIDVAGSGGMGAVYKIEHVITRRIEAMKILPPGSSSDPEQVQRFEREIQVQARLHHPNVVALYNAVRAGSSVALVMEFVEGECLQRKLESGPLPVATAVDFAGQVLGALAYAHDAGVIHRDVAPANIIITPDGTAKLTDFGLARGATDLRLSASGSPMGSPWYMSPEQVKGTGDLDARTDLYSMGAVLHEMLTGGKLFEAEGAFAVMRAHVELEPALPGSRNPEVPAALDEVVRKAVAKDPAMRFQSADEFRLALRAAAGGVQPVVAPSIPPLHSRPRWIRPSRAAGLVALAPAVLIAGFYTVRFFPAASRPPAVSRHESPPALPPAVLQVAPKASEIGSVALPETPVVEETPVATVRHRAPAAPARRRNRKTEPNDALRVSGGEPLPAAVMPAPGAAPLRPVEEPRGVGEKTDSAAASQALSPPGPPMVTGPEATAQDAAPVKPRNAGNRFVRALSKVNPFRKASKHEAGNSAASSLKKD